MPKAMASNKAMPKHMRGGRLAYTLRAMDTLASYMPERDLLKAKKLAKEYWVKHIVK